MQHFQHNAFFRSNSVEQSIWFVGRGLDQVILLQSMQHLGENGTIMYFVVEAHTNINTSFVTMNNLTLPHNTYNWE